MLKSVAGILLLCAGLCGSAAAAPMAGVDVEFYPNEYASSGPSTADSKAGKAGSDDTLDLAGVSDNELKTMSGGEGISDLQLNSANTTTAGSTNVVSGDVSTGTIQSTNVSGLSGFNTVLLNTGNNVTMQSVTQVNIILK